MHKYWLIFWYEYRKIVLTWQFAFNHFVLPLIFGLLLVVLLGVVLVVGTNRDPVGYVDQAGLFASDAAGAYRLPGFMERYLGTTFIAYPGEAEARAAMEQGSIQGYYVLPPDFRQTRAARLVYRKSPGISARTRFEARIRDSLLAEIPAQTRDLLVDRPTTLNFALSPKAAPDEHGSLSFVRSGFLILTIVVLFSVLTNCGGYLSKILVDEKTNRTVEILVTSVTPDELMLSKLAALLGVGLTELLISSSLPTIGLVVMFIAGLSVIRILPFSLLTLALILVLVLLTFSLLAVLIATYGAAISQPSDAENYILLPMALLAVFFVAFLVAEVQPSHPILVALSFFPLTALPVLMARLVFAGVPDVQLFISVLLMALACAGALWLIGRVFRASMLNFNTRLHLRALIRAHLTPRFRALARGLFQRSA